MKYCLVSACLSAWFAVFTCGPTKTARGQEKPPAKQAGLPERGICAHRGAVSTHPENTLPAFREAIRLGAHMIEFDVHLSRDGQLVVIHDSTVDRTTNGSGKVAELTFIDLRGLDAGSWKDARFQNERIPTLAETLRVMPENIWLNVHLKGGADLGEAVAREVVTHRRQHQSFLACSKAAAAAARRAAPDVLICNMDGQRGGREYVDATLAMRAEFLQFLRTPVEREWVALLDENQVRSNYCCTDDAKLIRKLLETGVGFVLVDRVDEAMAVAAKAGVKPLVPVFRPRGGK